MRMTQDFKDWIGRKIERQDVINERTIAEFDATLSPHLFATGAAPLGIHWCLSPDIVNPDQLGGDGHPKLGNFLPDVGLPRRMWAGGELKLHGQFKSGDVVQKQSVIADISYKTGNSGNLCFITVNHSYTVAAKVMLEERQDIVYREATSARVAHAQPPAVPNKTAWAVTPTSTMLFRYSAMTFNGHRIHYDDLYARHVEGYAGLVVHGPIQATLMLNLAATILKQPPQTFSYRGVSPLILGDPFHVDATEANGGLTLRTISFVGVVTMTATAAP
jgi:3-methylfumaryl-CoA hydratase